MSFVYVPCCGKMFDLDWDCDRLVYFSEENEYYCHTHAENRLTEKYGITDEQTLDEILYTGEFNGKLSCGK